jgi:hypothetical protein
LRGGEWVLLWHCAYLYEKISFLKHRGLRADLGLNLCASFMNGHSKEWPTNKRSFYICFYVWTKLICCFFAGWLFYHKPTMIKYKLVQTLLFEKQTELICWHYINAN